MMMMMLMIEREIYSIHRMCIIYSSSYMIQNIDICIYTILFIQINDTLRIHTPPFRNNNEITQLHILLRPLVLVALAARSL